MQIYFSRDGDAWAKPKWKSSCQENENGFVAHWMLKASGCEYPAGKCQRKCRQMSFLDIFAKNVLRTLRGHCMFGSSGRCKDLAPISANG